MDNNKANRAADRRAEDFKSALRLRVRTTDEVALVEEYIEEAEHQDGIEYWDQFAYGDDVWADFNVYLREM
jgi:hypothetical protein